MRQHSQAGESLFSSNGQSLSPPPRAKLNGSARLPSAMTFCDADLNAGAKDLDEDVDRLLETPFVIGDDFVSSVGNLNHEEHVDKNEEEMEEEEEEEEEE